MVHYKEVTMTDHELAAYLNSLGDWDYQHMSKYQTIYKVNGETVGYSMFHHYDNTRKTFIAK